MASPSANGSRPTAMFVTVLTANHIDASRHRRPVAWRRSRSARNAETAELSTATVQMPNDAPSSGNSTP